MIKWYIVKKMELWPNCYFYIIYLILSFYNYYYITQLFLFVSVSADEYITVHIIELIFIECNEGHGIAHITDT